LLTPFVGCPEGEIVLKPPGRYRTIGGTLETDGGITGAYALMDDDEAWQLSAARP
jgi:hypothetical protein